MDKYIMTYLIVILVIAAGLGLIPASIAKKKGHSFLRRSIGTICEPTHIT